MDQRAQIEALRQVVLQTLVELGTPEADWSLVKQTTLLRDRDHPGKRFEFHGVRAIWYNDRNIIDFFTEDGRFLLTVPVASPNLARPHAA
jgi:hypothetical protein